MTAAATSFTPWVSLVGGILIGLAALLLLAVEGRIAGISGIASGVVTQSRAGERQWRAWFLAGLVGSGFVLSLIWPPWYAVATSGPLWAFGLAGLIVGFGTRLGSGCTSGHGVCGVGRLSVRSMAATVIFLLTGMITVAVIRAFTGGMS